MNTLRFVIIFCALPWALGAQSGFGALYPATSGFTGRDVWVRDYEYRVYADQFDAATSTFTRIDMETGLDGTYWGFSGHTYAVPFGGRIVVDRGGDYVTAETFEAAPDVQKLRLSERQMNGQLVSLLDYTFPEVVSISIDQFVLPVPYGDYFVAGSYRRADAPQLAVPFLIKASRSGVGIWQTPFNPAGNTFHVDALMATPDGGCIWVHSVDGTDRYLEKFSGSGQSLWRQTVGGPLSYLSPPAEAPDGSVWLGRFDDPIPSAGGDAGALLHFATDGALLLDLPLNPVLGAHAVRPALIVPMSDGGAAVCGALNPALGLPARPFSARFDTDGALLWVKNWFFFSEPLTWATGRETPDGGIVCSGMAANQVFLLKTGAEGGAGNAAYCASRGEFPWHEWIARVQIGDLDQVSGKWWYTDHTTDLPLLSLEAGATVPLELTTGYSWETFDEYWSVWIDLDRNGWFDNAAERVFQGVQQRPPNGTTAAQLSGVLAIPESATLGPTRMRVSMQRGAWPSPCGDLPFGEVEDYAVALTDAGLREPDWAGKDVVQEVRVYPNPASDYLFVELRAPAGIRLFDAQGKLCLEKQGAEGVSVLRLDLLPAGIYWLALSRPGEKTASWPVHLVRN